MKRLVNDTIQADLGGHDVDVIGQTGWPRATWTLKVDGADVDSKEVMRGTHLLKSALPDGTKLEAEVIQSILGHTKVALRHDGEIVSRSKGFVS